MKSSCSFPFEPNLAVLSVLISASLEAFSKVSLLASHLSLSESWEFKKVTCDLQEEEAFVIQIPCGVLENIHLQILDLCPMSVWSETLWS